MEGIDRIPLRHKLTLVTTLLLLATSAVFCAIIYRTQSEALLNGIDQELLAAAHLAATVPPEGYFDAIADKDSVSPEQFTRIVDRNNRLCIQLELQYLWSCMLLEDEVVFTTSTSPGKDVARGDHAGFLEVHRDPHAFDAVFSTMEPDFSSFMNEWGHGRMVLVPDVDSHGRQYCYGASMSVNDVHVLLRKTLVRSLLLGTAILVVGIILSAIVSRTLSRPIAQLTSTARSIAEGDLSQPANVTGSAEIRSLSHSIAVMSDAIREKLGALEQEIVERKAAEQELEKHKAHLEEVVQQRTEALERSNAELAQFAYIASHDLQEPLRTVRSFTDLLNSRYSGRLDDDADEFIGFIVDATTRMQRLIGDLLAYSRVDTRGRPFARADMNDALDQAISNLRSTIDDASATVTHDDLPIVWADAVQVAQLLQNLIANGIKFRSDASPEIHVGARKDADDWVFSVRDNGIGIGPEYRERIFVMFQRLHSRSEYPGTGIGLAFCKKIVERHGGRIWVKSEEGTGSTFYFTVPGRLL